MIIGKMPPKKRFIAVAGNMGAGKSELVSFLCRRYGLKPFFEPNDTNPYLADFYRDMRSWAFRSSPGPRYSIRKFWRRSKAG